MCKSTRAEQWAGTGGPPQCMHRGVQQVWGCRATPSPFSVAVRVHPVPLIPSGVGPAQNAREKSGRVVPRAPCSPNPMGGARGCKWVGAPTPHPNQLVHRNVAPVGSPGSSGRCLDPTCYGKVRVGGGMQPHARRSWEMCKLGNCSCRRRFELKSPHQSNFRAELLQGTHQGSQGKDPQHPLPWK